jgi:hypothetical protein
MQYTNARNYTKIQIVLKKMIFNAYFKEENGQI